MIAAGAEPMDATLTLMRSDPARGADVRLARSAGLVEERDFAQQAAAARAAYVMGDVRASQASSHAIQIHEGFWGLSRA